METTRFEFCIWSLLDLLLGYNNTKSIYCGMHPREFPLYSCQSGYHALRIPYSTLYSWINNNPEESLISNAHSYQTLNFLQLSEAFTINYMRRSIGIPLSKIREASDYLRGNLEISYPLIDHRIRVGQPSIDGTGITVEIVQDRFGGGKSLIDIAAGYGIALAGVEDALAYVTL